MDIITKLKKIKKVIEIPTKYLWPRVIMFHSAYPIIDRGDVFQNWNSSTQKIKDIINYLQKHGEIIDEDEFLDIIKNKTFAEGKFLITFDDGYKKIFDQLAEYLFVNKIKPLLFLSAGQFLGQVIPWFAKTAILFRHTENTVFVFRDCTFDISDVNQRINLYAHLQKYIISECKSIEQADNVIKDLYQQSKNVSFDNLVLDEDMQLLSKKEIDQLIAQGWGIGSHGFTHYPLTILDNQQLEFDLVESKRIIQSTFQVNVRSISYPNGCINKTVCEKVMTIYEAGFCALPSKQVSRFLIPRFGFPEDENRIRKLVWKASEASSVIKIAKNGYSSSFFLMLLNNVERTLLLSRFLPKYNAITPNIIELEGLTLNVPLSRNSDDTNQKPEIVLLCGAGCPERYALSQLSKKYTIKAVFIDSSGSCKPYQVFRPANDSTCLPEDIPTHILTPYIRYSDNEQEKIFGSDSLAWFVTYHTKIYSIRSINDPDVTSMILSINPSLIIVFGTSIIRDEKLLNSNIPKFNLHWGLSPWYRGSYTVRWPIMENCFDKIGVTIHVIDKGIDSGYIISQGKPVLDGTENIREIEYKCTLKGIELLIELIENIKTGKKPLGVKQDLAKGKFYSVKKWNSKVNATIENILLNGFVYKNTDTNAKYSDSNDMINTKWE